ncbi:MAG: GAF domain-containing protein, partial [Elusimicrobia bacterium]|nr:GAF domain-containing protein [Elusimicrobiota bacterium]
RELNAIIEPGKLFSFIIDSITGTMHSERAFIMLMDERSGEFRIVQSRGIDDASARAMSLAESDAIVRWSREYKKIFTIEEFLERPCNEPLNATEQSLCNLASLVIPLICKGKHIGLVFLSEKMSGAIFNRDDINFLSAVATQASISVENAGLYESIINMEKKLHRADKLTALGTLAGSVAHEIKNPLVSIKTFTQLLPARFGDEVFRKKFERIVSEEIDRMENVVGQLLAFSRSSVTGGTEKQSEDVSIDATMEDLLELMKYEIYKNKIRIIKDYGENLPVIKGNARQLKQVFMNIILNAIQAMPSGGDITVGMHSADNNLEIYFQDTGSGISEEDISRIFTPFFTTKPEGTGLGLSISKRIIQEHSGHIAAGAAPSGGTRFTIKLPVPVPPAIVSD